MLLLFTQEIAKFGKFPHGRWLGVSTIASKSYSKPISSRIYIGVSPPHLGWSIVVIFYTYRSTITSMKYSFSLVALAICATDVIAFPSRMFDLSMNEAEKRAIAELSSSIEASANEGRSVKRTPGFSASQQYVSNTGAHAYKAPGPSDLRGPCPGLNAMANHGYIPHNGVATITQFIQGTYDGTHSSAPSYSVMWLTFCSLWHGIRSRRLSGGLWCCYRW